jgi:hypothetical protein
LYNFHSDIIWPLSRSNDIVVALQIEAAGASPIEMQLLQKPVTEMNPEGRFRNRLGSTQKRLVKARLGTAKSVSEIPLVSCGIIRMAGRRGTPSPMTP